MKVVILASFFDAHHYVGRIRMLRFIRTLAARQVELVVIAAGPEDAERVEPWGRVITVARAFRLCRSFVQREITAPVSSRAATARPRAGLLNVLHHLFIYPDMDVLWARGAAASPRVREACAGADWVISSNPPESMHVGGARLAEAIGAKHMMDMRDGWIDEPLRAWIAHTGLRHTIEAAQERRIMRHASAIVVTSEVWRSMLCQRLPEALHGRVHVLRNAAPEVAPAPVPQAEGALTLLHAGRLLGSRATRSPTLFLALLDMLRDISPLPLRLVFLGSLGEEEVRLVKQLERDAGPEGPACEVCIKPHVPHSEAIAQMQQSHGLFLMEKAKAVIPCKLYDYLAAERPILNIAIERDCAAERIGEGVEGLFTAATTADTAAMRQFLAAAASNRRFPMPANFSEAAHGHALTTILGM